MSVYTTQVPLYLFELHILEHMQIAFVSWHINILRNCARGVQQSLLKSKLLPIIFHVSVPTFGMITAPNDTFPVLLDRYISKAG